MGHILPNRNRVLTNEGKSIIEGLDVISSTQFAGGADSAGHAACATLNALTASSTNRQTFVQFGIRHKFCVRRLSSRREFGEGRHALAARATHEHGTVQRP
jgi:hypothetical protein